MLDRWAQVRAVAAQARRDLPHAGDLGGMALVEALLAHRGFEIARHPSSHSLLGGAWAALFPDIGLAVLDLELSPERQAFALAHELGHLLLHTADGGCGDGDIDPQAATSDSVMGALEIYNPRQQREREANVFALALLLPPDLLHGLFVRQGLGAPAIARRLGVSLAATLGALADLLQPGSQPLVAPQATPAHEHASGVGAHSRAPAPAQDDDRDLPSLSVQSPCLRVSVVSVPRPSSQLPSEPADEHATAVAPVSSMRPQSQAGSQSEAGGQSQAGAPQAQPSSEPMLDRSQRTAAEHTGPRALVQAGPGTGKTGTLVGRAIHLLRDRAIDPRQILVVTFSNRAAGELRTRLAASVGAAASAMTIGTLHSFAHDLLRRYGAHAGLAPDFEVVDTPGALVLLRARLAEFDAALAALNQSISLEAPVTALSTLLEAVSRAKDELVDAEEFARRVASLPEPDEASARQAAFYSWYDRTLAAAGGLDYGDLIRFAVDLLRAHPAVLAEVRDSYPWVLVDEYQDLNLACSTLVDLVAPGQALWAVGDARQSIYRWRGARPEALERLHGADPTAMPVLSTNYRSTAPIVRLCGGLAATMQGVPVDDGRASWLARRGEPDDGLPAVTVAVAADEAAELSGMATAIRTELQAGRRPHEIAVLCRTHAQAAAIAAGLERLGIAVSRSDNPDDNPTVRAALALLALASGDGEALLRLAVDDQASHAAGTPSPQPLMAPAGAAPHERGQSLPSLSASSPRLRALRPDGRSIDQIYLAAVYVPPPSSQTHTIGGPPAMQNATAVAPSAAVRPQSQAGSMPLTRASAWAILRHARDRGISVRAALRRPPESLDAGQRGAARRLAAFIRSISAERSAGTAAAPTWTAIARFLFDAPFNAALPLLAEADQQSLAAVAALLAYARRYDRQPAALREPTLAQQVRLLLSGGETLEGYATDTAAGVQVLTIHASKGLEFPVVFVPNLAHGRFPARGRPNQGLSPRVLGYDEAGARAEDERCLFFVALSRARDRLVLSRAERYGARTHEPSPLLALLAPSFALEPPATVSWHAETAAPSDHPDEAASAQSPARPEGATSADENIRPQSEARARPESPSHADAQIPAYEHATAVAPVSAMTPQCQAGAQQSEARERSQRPDGLVVDMYALETYLACPRRYYYEHVAGLRGSPGYQFPHFHQALRRALARLGPAEVGDTDAALAVLDEEWRRPHDPHPHERLFLERARRAIRAAAQAEGPGNAAAEHRVELDVVRPGGTIKVQIDRLEHRAGDPPLAVRYRTGRPSDVHRREHRTALYHAALEAAHGSGRVRQEYVLSGEADEQRARSSTLESRLRECDDALTRIARSEFDPRPSDACPACPFWLICPEG